MSQQVVLRVVLHVYGWIAENVEQVVVGELVELSKRDVWFATYLPVPRDLAASCGRDCVTICLSFRVMDSVSSITMRVCQHTVLQDSSERVGSHGLIAHQAFLLVVD